MQKALLAFSAPNLTQKGPQTGPIESSDEVLARREERPRAGEIVRIETRKRSFFAVSRPFCRISAAEEQAGDKEHEGRLVPHTTHQ